MNCPLCTTETKNIIQVKNISYFKCSTCFGIFIDPVHFLSPQKEKKRYESHNNDINDPGYQKFVSPIVDSILKFESPETKGLDFGCGTGPVICKMLSDKRYKIVTYDPFFCNNPELLKENEYEYIFSCEVIEHFHNPAKEFELMKNLLKPNGKLYLMTQLISDETPFVNWSYKNDPTHVFFYHENTFKWIVANFGFKNIKIIGRLVVIES